MRHVRVGDLHLDFEGDKAVILRSLTHGKAVRAPQFAAALVSWCGAPRTREDVAEQFGAPAAGLYDALVRAGILVAPETAADTPGMFDYFGRVDVHEMMLADRVRVEGYRAAIEAAVTPGMVVMDAGTGSGILAMYAAKAGAARVYAVDNSAILEHAARNIEAAGLADVVQTVAGDFATVELPEKVDLIITETFGSMAFVEGASVDLRACCARNLKPGGRVLPDGVDFYVAPVSDPEVLRRAVGVFDDIHGVNLSPLRRAAQHKAVQLRVAPGSLAHAGVRFGEAGFPDEDAVMGTATFQGLEPGAEMVGLAGWFGLRLWEGHTMTIGPTDPETCWLQTFLPAPVRASEEGTLDVQMRVTPAHDNRRRIEIAVRVGEDFERLYRL
jgi:type I protein arginine methyltransferase